MRLLDVVGTVFVCPKCGRESVQEPPFECTYEDCDYRQWPEDEGGIRKTLLLILGC